MTARHGAGPSPASPPRCGPPSPTSAPSPTWAPNVDHSCLLTAGPVGPGTTRRVQVGALALLEEITAWDPGVLLAYRITGLPPVAGDVMTEWTLQPAGAGETHVTVTTSVAGGPRPPQQLVARALALRLRRAADQMLAGLAGARRAARTT